MTTVGNPQRAATLVAQASVSAGYAAPLVYAAAAGQRFEVVDLALDGLLPAIFAHGKLLLTAFEHAITYDRKISVEEGDLPRQQSPWTCRFRLPHPPPGKDTLFWHRSATA